MVMRTIAQASAVRRRSPARIILRLLLGGLAAVSTLGLAACDAGSARRSAAPARSPLANECTGEDPHTKHINLGFACETCHPKGGEYGAAGTLPGGTPVSGTITRGTPTTCAVSCHSPSGAPIQTVAWNQGTLTCVSCHTTTLVAGARSAHAAGTDRAACLVCHDVAAHFSGVVRLTFGDGTPGNTACLSCHSGVGKAVGGKAPPVVAQFGPGGTDAHGDSGAEPARRCVECHDAHASTSAFMLGSRSDPLPLPANAVASRAGVGAEALCGRCHASRHQSCSAICHVDGHEDVWWVDRVIHATDPAPPGSACFACHGHEGIVYGDGRKDYRMFAGFYDPGTCAHCHRFRENLPPVETTPPDVAALVLSNDGIASVKATWSSLEAASSYVELWDAGASDLVEVTGDGVLRFGHTVQVPALDPARPRQVRVRTTDRMRNVTITASDVVSIGAPATPVAKKAADAVTCTPAAIVQLTWSASADPNGDALAYELQVSDSPRFETLLASETTAVGTTNHALSLAAAHGGLRYYWRVRAREARPQGLTSTWSGVESFALYIDEEC